MSKQTEPVSERKNRLIGYPDSGEEMGGEVIAQFVDQRPQAIIQRKLQEMVNESDQVAQAKSVQAWADQGSQAEQGIQLKGLAKAPFSHRNKTENEAWQVNAGPIQGKDNKTGLPDQLKSGIENLSGLSLDDVKVHHNSSQPAQLKARAFAQGSEIHLGTGQEKHLAHEAWHVVQQKQGRVTPTSQMKGNLQINNDVKLEKEADIMGEKALSSASQDSKIAEKIDSVQSSSGVIQGKFGFELEMAVPFGFYDAGGVNKHSIPGKTEGIANSNGPFKVFADHIGSESKVSQIGGAPVKKLNSIVELVTDPIDEASMDRETFEAVADEVVLVGHSLVAEGRAKSEARLQTIPGFGGADEKYFVGSKYATVNPNDTAYVQATTGVDLASLNEFIIEIAGREKGNEGSKTEEKGASLLHSIVSVDEVAHKLDDKADQVEVAKIAGYLTYISLVLREGVKEKNLGASMKNYVYLLNRASVNAPDLGSVEIRNDLRSLVMEKSEVAQDLRLFPSIEGTATVGSFLNTVLPATEDTDPNWNPSLLQEEKLEREEDDNKDVIFEDRRVNPDSGFASRVKVGDWKKMFMDYYDILRNVHNLE